MVCSKGFLQLKNSIWVLLLFSIQVVLVGRLAWPQDIAVLTSEANGSREKAEQLVKEYAGKRVPVDVEEKIHGHFKKAIEGYVELIKIDKDNLSKHQENLRETRSSYFWFRKLSQSTAIAGAAQDTQKDPFSEDDAERKEKREEVAAEKYQAAVAYEEESSGDLWGIKAKYEDVLDCFGSSYTDRSRKKVAEYEVKISEWNSEEDVRFKLSKAKSKMELLSLKHQFAAGTEEMQALRKTIKDMVDDRDLDMAQEFIEKKFQDASGTNEARAEVSRVRDYIRNVIDLFVYAQQGAQTMIGDDVWDLYYYDGEAFKAKVLGVEAGKVKVTIPDSRIESMSVSLFRLSDASICRMAKRTDLPEVNRLILGSYILTDDVSRAAKLLEEIPDASAWKKTYAVDVERRATIAELESEIKEENRRIEKMDRLFKPFFQNVKKRDYDESINGPLAKILKSQADILDEDIRRLDQSCREAAAEGLYSAMSAAKEKCTICNSKRYNVCPRCNGEGKVRRVGPAESNAPKYVTCPKCNNLRKDDVAGGAKSVIVCMCCFEKYNCEGNFSSLGALLSRIEDVLSDE